MQWPKACCICQILRAKLRRQMLAEAATVHTSEGASGRAGNASFLLVVLTKGLLRGTRRAEVLLGVPERSEQPCRFPISADYSFDSPSQEFGIGIEQHGNCAGRGLYDPGVMLLKEEVDAVGMLHSYGPGLGEPGGVPARERPPIRRSPMMQRAPFIRGGPQNEGGPG